MRQVTAFISDKYGLKPAMHSGEPAYRRLPMYFLDSFTFVLARFLDAAAATGKIRTDIPPDDLMRVLSGIAAPDDHAFTQRMIDLLVNGLRRNRPTKAPESPTASGNEHDLADMQVAFQHRMRL